MADEREVNRLTEAILADWTAFNDGQPVSNLAITAPRRKHADVESSTLAHAIADQMFPSDEPSLYSVIQYEKRIIALRAAWAAQLQAENDATEMAKTQKTWKFRMKAQGAWDEIADLVSYAGPAALPMPVEISDAQSLAPFFEYLAQDGTFEGGKARWPVGTEPYFKSPFIEFEKGALYQDQRMDLCKQVLGPQHIGTLMKALETNTFVKHFLLGNNLIGPRGAHEIANYLSQFPSQIQTWYIAGACIDGKSFEELAAALQTSQSCQSLWLKRNPLGPDSALSIANMLISMPSLRTLDLDLTELGDVGVTRLFERLYDHLATTPAPPVLPLSTIYLNADGIGPQACVAMARYLEHPLCGIQNLFMNTNPIGSRGAIALARGLERNTSLLRLVMASTGLTSSGAIALAQALVSHPRILTIELGQAYTSNDIAGARYNWIGDDAIPALCTLIRESKTLRCLSMGLCPISQTSLDELFAAVKCSKSLVAFEALPLDLKRPNFKDVRYSMFGNLGNLADEFPEVKAAGPFVVYDDFAGGDGLRLLQSPGEDQVKWIRSIYRTRDMGKSRRHEMILKKLWDEGDNTLQLVQEM